MANSALSHSMLPSKSWGEQALLPLGMLLLCAMAASQIAQDREMLRGMADILTALAEGTLTGVAVFCMVLAALIPAVMLVSALSNRGR